MSRLSRVRGLGRVHGMGGLRVAKAGFVIFQQRDALCGHGIGSAGRLDQGA